MRFVHLFLGRHRQTKTTRTNTSIEDEDDDYEEEERFNSERERIVAAKDRRNAKPSPSLPSPSSPKLILPELMTPKEFEARLREGVSVPSSLIKGRTYFLQMGKRIKVLDKRKNKVSYLCVGTRETIEPVEEHMTLYLNLVLNEKELIRTANVMNTDSQHLLVEVSR
jgi:hypothetical protein